MARVSKTLRESKPAPASVNLSGIQKVYRKLRALPLGQWLYPGLCTLCDARSQSNRDLCDGCLADLPFNRHACLQCALPLPAHIPAPALCGACLQPGQPRHFDQVWAPFIYAPPLPWLVTQLKFHQRLQHARLLAELMWSQLEAPLQHQADARPDLILPVPLHAKRLRQRGFNQAIELARPLARISGIRLDSAGLIRIKATERQSDLPLRQRRRNVRNAFACNRELAGLHVVLVDDVMTTGNTIEAAATAARSAGASRVSAWVVARTPA